MLHKIVEPDETGDETFLLYMLPILIVYFHPFRQTRNAFRYKYISTIDIITIGIDMLGTICELEIIKIRKNFRFCSKDQYNACINSFLDFDHT